MKKDYFLAALIPVFLVLGCNMENPDPGNPGPEPIPDIRFIGRDSISEGNYRGISINSSSDDAFMILEDYRKRNMVAYVGAVNNFFADITDIENRLHLFEWLVLDEKFDTDSGVQLQLESGRVKSITLNNRKSLNQWPETAKTTEAVQVGDQSGVLYSKLLALSKQTDFSKKFERIVFLDKYTYALYDPGKASLPWTFIYSTASQDTTEQVGIYFKDKKVDYILVNHFKQK